MKIFVPLIVLLVMSLRGVAFAQIAPPPNEWSHGTTLNVFAGAASASSETGPLIGGAVGWEVARWFALEGSGARLDRPDGAGAFAADLKALVCPQGAHAIVPFVEGGVGLYRASFDLSRGVLPDFYRGRITGNASIAGTTVTFTDPSFVLGAGVNLFVTRHIAIRPDIDVKIVRRHSQSYAVTAVAVHLAYHFEEHPLVPDVRLGRSRLRRRP
jgi:hypothetical protein